MSLNKKLPLARGSPGVEIKYLKAGRNGDRIKNMTRALILVLVIALASSACSKAAATSTISPKPTTAAQTSAPPKTTPAAKASPTPTPTTITTPLARPATGKSQEITIALKAPGDVYSFVIYLVKGERFDLDWKFVANPQVGIRFMFTTPDGREMDAGSKPLNLPGHPLYDPSLPTQKIEEAVGSSVVIKVGQDPYCVEGYYSLVFTGSPTQSGIAYLRYDLAPPKETSAP
jgi:hypothetical protein